MGDIAPSNQYIAPVPSWRVLVGPIWVRVGVYVCFKSSQTSQMNTILAETIKNIYVQLL